MPSLRHMVTVAAVTMVAALANQPQALVSAHVSPDDPVHNLGEAVLQELRTELSKEATTVAAEAEADATAKVQPRHLRVQHDGHGATGDGKTPGGLLGPLVAMFPTLMSPISMVSDTIHNSNAAITGVQHTPDGIFQPGQSVPGH